MTQPQRYLSRMILFLIVVAIAAGLLFPQLSQAFMANAVLNGVILGVLLIGIVHIFRSVTMLRREVAWVESFKRDSMTTTSEASPRLLAPMATMLGERTSDRLRLSTTAMRSLLDGIATRLDEGREISRYFIGLLVFLGLLGTFWGLLETVKSISDVIGGLSVDGGGVQSVFEDLKTGLKAPLGGMGTAFSSSLFGLAGSLVLGFLALQAGQAQNSFYNEFEEWLSGLTRLGTSNIGSEGDQPIPAYIQALLEQTADSLEGLQRTIARGEEGRIDANNQIAQLSDSLRTLTESMRAEQNLMLRLAESQMELKPVLTRLADAQAGGVDAALGNHIRNVESLLGRLVEDSSQGRTESVQEIRDEIRLLARTIAAAAEDDGR
ncbi:MAG: flagellar motor protein MotA [Alphaproteobacteria bacterium]|jgi:hypothetical protein|nr:flagellar motor protein MotA [Alphaproteobacteria bacterium]MDP6604224.1 flagellar motor protein MotA [Rhodospirillales bacterium]